jgi:anti-anti-sigma factor
MSLRPEHRHELAVAVVDQPAVVRVRGEVDIATAPRLRGALAEEQWRRQQESAAAPLVVDLSEVTFMGACGLGVLVRALGEARRSGGDLVLRNPTSTTMRMLDLTGLLDVFAVEWEPDVRSLLPVA